MSLIELTGTEDDVGLVRSVMLYPRDDRARRLYHAIHFHTVLLKGAPDETRWPVSAGLLRQLLSDPNPAAAETIRARTRRATVAGELLSVIYLMSRFKAVAPAFEHPSLNKAIYVVQTWADKYSYRDGTEIPSSRKGIRDCWEEFRPVAHLWAAQAINSKYPFVEPGEEFTSKANLDVFLGVAAGLFRFGRGFNPTRSTGETRLLDAERSWTIPASIAPLELPKGAEPPDLLLRVVRTYKAESIKKPGR